MIKPTIGRQVLYRPRDTMDELSVRHTATIAFCHSDTMVNLGVLDEQGLSYNEQLVRLVHGTEACLPGCCEFPPYAKSKAGIEPMERPVPQELSDEALDERIKKVSSVWNELGRNLSDEALQEKINDMEHELGVRENAPLIVNAADIVAIEDVKPGPQVELITFDRQGKVVSTESVVDNSDYDKKAPVKKAAKPKPAAKG